MFRKDALSRLAEHRGRLKELHVKSLAIFGSVARDEARADSAVDILVEFDAPPTFDLYMRLKLSLQDVLDRKVELFTRNSIRPELKPHVEREAVNAA